MNLKQYKGAVESLVFASGEPVTARRIAEVLEIEEPVVERLLLNIREDYERDDCGLCLLQLNDSWQMATKAYYGDYVRRLMDNRRNTPLSQAALEILAIIAYNQPVSRGFVEQVRGVDSSSTISKLMERGLIEEAGRLNLPGHPISFRTTDVFLRTFGLRSLAELPPLHEEELPLEEIANNAEAVALFKQQLTEVEQ